MDALPGPQDSALLCACLSSGESARDAWRKWIGTRRALNPGLSDDESVRKLRPLIFKASESHRLEIDKESQTFLRSAYLREELRYGIFSRVCREVLRRANHEQIPLIVLKGAALAESVYDTPVLRHSHDIEVLVKTADVDRVANMLRSCKFHPAVIESEWCRRLEHDSGLPLRIHTSLFDISAYNVALDEVWSNSRVCTIAGTTARMLSPEDNLLHVVGYASYSRSCHSWRWITDAWFLIKRSRDLKWERVLDSARRHGMTTPLSIMLGYLARELGAAIPPDFMERLHAESAQSSNQECEAALWALVANGRVRPEHLLRAASSWRSRFSVMKWLILPPADFLRWGEGVRHTWLLPLYYFYRPIRFAVRRTVRP
jgi:hypothetical protein